MANRFELAAQQPRGTLTRAQERFLITQAPAILAEHRRRVNVFNPIPKLSKRQAWLLINSIAKAGGEA